MKKLILFLFVILFLISCKNNLQAAAEEYYYANNLQDHKVYADAIGAKIEGSIEVISTSPDIIYEYEYVETERLQHAIRTLQYDLMRYAELASAENDTSIHIKPTIESIKHAREIVSKDSIIIAHTYVAIDSLKKIKTVYCHVYPCVEHIKTKYKDGTIMSREDTLEVYVANKNKIIDIR